MFDCQGQYHITEKDIVSLYHLPLDDELKSFMDKVADAVFEKRNYLPGVGTLKISTLRTLYSHMNLFERQMELVGRPANQSDFQVVMLANLRAVARTVQSGELPFPLYLLLHEHYLANVQKFVKTALEVVKEQT